MKVRINYTVDVDDHTRRAINEHYGRPGLATNAEVKRWYEANGHSMDDDLSNITVGAGELTREPWEGTQTYEAVEP